LHTRVTHTQEIIWRITLIGQISVGLFAWYRRNRCIAWYLTIVGVTTALLYSVGHLASAQVYYVAYCWGTALNYAAEFYLAYAIFATIRATGTTHNRPQPLGQLLLLSLLAISVLHIQYPLTHVLHPDWRWFVTADHLFYSWLSISLGIAPFYSLAVDSAKDQRLLLSYLGFAIYAWVHAGAVDVEVISNFTRRFPLMPTIAYFAALCLWSVSSVFKPGKHEWNPEWTEPFKEYLRKRPRFQFFNPSRKATSL
jgi:hypothetical protein